MALAAIHWDWDLATGSMAFNRGVGHLFGESPPDDATRAWWEARVHADDRAAMHDAFDALRDGRAVRVDVRYRLRASSGYVGVTDRAFLVEHGGRPHRIVGAVRPDELAAPVTVPPAERLAFSERRFETFVESLPLLAWEADAEGWIDFYNDRWYQYTGATLAEMEGWGWVRVHDPLDLPRMLGVWRNALESGQPWEDAFRLRRADGTLRWHLSRAIPVRDEGGRIVRWFGTNTDIHEQRLALEERERLLQAEQRTRLAAEAANREKDEFLAVVSHELRTPLNAMLLWTQHLQQTGDASRIANGVERIHRNGRVLARLIEDLLDVSRIISGKLELDRQPTSLREAVDNAIETMKGDAAKKSIAIQFRKPTTPTAVLGSAARLEQIVCNLVGNAIKFSSAGSEVELTLTSNGDDVVLEVADHGDGIAPELLPHVFDRFRQGDASATRRHGGLGLGLAIVRHLTELHGGTVTAASAGRGLGAAFTLRLPRLSSATTLAAAPLPPSRAASLAGIRILAVDDEPEAREALAVVLLSCGATVTLAGSAAEALERLRSDEIDLILSDIAMPDVDGYGFAERLRALGDPRVSALPLIAVTAHASPQDRVTALRRGFNAYVTKPLEVVALSHVITELMRARIVGS